MSDHGTKAEDLMRLGREVDPDDEVMGPLLSAIFAQQERDAAYYQSVQDHWFAEARAKLRIYEDGIAWAQRNCGWGGTTRDYELCLERIDSLRYTWGTEILAWYKEKELEHGPFSNYAPHPKFLSSDDPRGCTQ